MPAKFHDVTTEIEGRRYRGTWTLKQGGLLCVCWPMHDVEPRTVELGTKRPEVVAERVLKQIVERWLTQQRRFAEKQAKPITEPPP
jgi:hypothetical protein